MKTRHRPYINGHRSFIKCPSCGGFFVNRRYRSCIFCDVGLKFKGEYIYEGDYYWNEGKWITYEELSKQVK